MGSTYKDRRFESRTLSRLVLLINADTSKDLTTQKLVILSTVQAVQHEKELHMT